MKRRLRIKKNKISNPSQRGDDKHATKNNFKDAVVEDLCVVLEFMRGHIFIIKNAGWWLTIHGNSSANPRRTIRPTVRPN